ncbi:hypothetical protein BASA81_003540 [Batrachochytrium salamandrivorans]|nr:hypothetical protein BASA81_003540 [Batrachochytrium salamandrivorans]
MKKPFWRAVDAGDVDLIRQRYTDELVARDAAGSSVLHRAARHNRLELISYLLNNALIEVNVVDTGENKTPLYEAACEGHLAAVVLLMDKYGADATISKFNEWNPLHIASCKGFDLLAKEIGIRCPRAMAHRNKDGALPLHLACREGHIAVIEQLVRLGSELDVRNNNGRSPFLCACASGSLASLLALGCEVSTLDANVIDLSGFTPLHEASSVEIVEWLLERNDDVSRWLAYQDVCGGLPIHIAASNDRPDVLRALLLQRPDLVNEKDGNGCTALLLACGKGHALVVQVLLQFQADQTLEDKHDRTPLQVASQWERRDVVQLLERRAVALSGGGMMPTVGLGTFRLGDATYNAVLESLKLGYRSVDCAEYYGNEAEVGRAIKDSQVPRSELFVTSKIWNSNVSSGNSAKALRDIVARLQIGHLDLVLVHWPCPGYVDAFVELLRYPELATYVGASNFLPQHVEEIKRRTGRYPVLNQMEFSAYFARRDQVEYFLRRGIVVQAYRSLGKEGFVGKQRATVHKPSPQALLRWRGCARCLIR